MPGPIQRPPQRTRLHHRQEVWHACVDDHEPCPDDGMGDGDYPEDPQDLRTNWGEPLHWDLDMYIRSRMDTMPTPVSWDLTCKQLLGPIAFMVFLFWIGDVFPSYQPVGPKQDPCNNLYLERGGDPTKEPEPVLHYDS
ncbi:NADH dehydrogenase [ubiquinone] 1 beta subcomplex subunit 8, mitochondrial-like [Thomomys bottae]